MDVTTSSFFSSVLPPQAKREKAKNYAIEGKIKKIEKDDIETMSIRGKIKGM